MPRRSLEIACRPVMITGAAYGIGRGLARRLSGLSSPVAIADVDEAGLKATEAALSGLFDAPARIASTRYYAMLERLQSRLRARPRGLV